MFVVGWGILDLVRFWLAELFGAIAGAVVAAPVNAHRALGHLLGVD